MREETKTVYFSELEKVLPPIVFRNWPKWRDVLPIAPRTVANEDSKGSGPTGKVMIGVSADTIVPILFSGCGDARKSLREEATMEKDDPIRLLFAIGFTEGGYEPSLENFIENNFLGPKDEKFKITINRCPELVRSTILALRHKHKKFVSQAAVTRFLTKQGVKILQRIGGIQILKELRKEAYEEGDERDRLVLSRHSYDFRYRVSLTTQRITVYAEEWVYGAITELACDIGTFQETITIMSLIAASATSQKWIPSRHLCRMQEELIHFVQWVDELASTGECPSL